MKLRTIIVKKLFNSFGLESFIKDDVTIKGFENMKIGNNTAINKGCYFNAIGGINIGNNVAIAHDCSFHTNSHNYFNIKMPIGKQGQSYKEINIEDDVWIGCNTVILQGVTIGQGSVIGANSLVNKDIPNFSIAGGSPAKIIKKRI
jgi:acetyltransferase-like isoleucine patch superfamily enzyme